LSDQSSAPSGDIETASAQGRLTDRTYASRAFNIASPQSRDHGQPARFVYKVVENTGELDAKFDGECWTVSATEGGRYQFKLLVARDAGRVKDLWIQRVPQEGASGRIRQILHLRRQDAASLIELFRTLDHIPVTNDAERVRVDDSLIRDLFENPDSIMRVYEEDREMFRDLIRNDTTARDLIATAHRREQVERFRRLLDDADLFDREASGRGPESVWQRFLEQNPWILGVSLGGQLMTAWDDDRLEQVVSGRSIGGPGKRADALLKTAGRVRSMVFAEIKHHRTPLLDREYRSGCWSPSNELSGGVAQAQGTVQHGIETLGSRIPSLSADGTEIPGDFAYLFRPRSYLVIGRLDEFVGQMGGHHQDKVRSFELYRRHLDSPEVITFDELLARAEWLVGDDPTPRMP